MHIKFENPKLKQSETENYLGYSTSTLQQYKSDIICFRPIVFSQISLINEQKLFQIQIQKQPLNVYLTTKAKTV